MSERSGIITMKGKPLTLKGSEVKVGDNAPDVTLIDNDLNPVKLSSYKGKLLLILSVPSLDTSVCSTETNKFNKEVAPFGQNVATLVISRDLPFAQKRWCGQEKANQVKTLSDYHYREFGEKYGVLIKEIELLARAVFIIDPQMKIRYEHIVKEVTSEPPYAEVLTQTKKLL